MHRCPTCQTTFDTSRGLRVHHSAAHDELLPNRECAFCGTRFHSEHEKKYCSDECRESAVSFEGENNPNYRGGKRSTECTICGASFEYYPSAKSGLYCEACVENEQWRYKREISGEQNPRWSGGARKRECNQCGATFERVREFSDNGRTFCSDDCQYEWLSEAFAGDGHPNWKGGTEANYGKGWNRVRKRALERDGYRCVICGKTKAGMGRNPDVHHVVPVRAFVETPATTERDAHYLGNVVSLCIGCHRKAEFGRISRERLAAAVG